MKKFYIILTTSILILLLVVFISLSLVPKSDTEGKEVVFWTLQMNDFTPYMTDVIAKFEYENPEIDIKWIDVPFT